MHRKLNIFPPKEMKTILFLSLIAAVAFANDDVVKMMSGFLEGLQVPVESKPEILRCAGDEIWNTWQEVVPKVRLIVGDSPAGIREGMDVFLRGPLESLTFLSACGQKPLDRVNKLSEKATKNLVSLHSHYIYKANDLFTQFKSFLESWDKYEYVEAGKKAGKMTLLMFSFAGGPPQ